MVVMQGLVSEPTRFLYSFISIFIMKLVVVNVFLQWNTDLCVRELGIDALVLVSDDIAMS